MSLAPLVTEPASPGFAKDWVKSGSIARLYDRDDAEIWKGWKRWVFALVPFLTFANTGLYLFYLGLRICMHHHGTECGPVSAMPVPGFSSAIEITVAIPSLMHNCWTMMALKKRGRAKAAIDRQGLPDCRCLHYLLRRGGRSRSRYCPWCLRPGLPARPVPIIVLDDAKSETLEESCSQMAMIYPNRLLHGA